MLLRALIFMVPLVVGFLVGRLIGGWLGNPETPAAIAIWWVLVVAGATSAATLTDRFARRLLPITVMLRMTMLFPDRAPSRLRVARRTGNVSELRRRITRAQQGENPDLGEISELILSLSTALSHHDRKTRGHSERTRAYTDLLAEEMGLSETDCDRLRWAALLHDVGKLEVPTEILNKDSALTHEEWHQVRQHPVAGMKLVAPLVPWLGQWSKTIEHHHEKWDGTGYPHGLAGTEIALGARVVAVADAFDVMTTGRSYQPAMTADQARREIARQAGKQFDPMVARALMNVSLGRLRWSLGPLAVFAQLPLIRGIPHLGRDALTLVASSAVMATTVVAGIVPMARPPVADFVAAVVAGTGLTNLPDVLALPDAAPGPEASSDPTTPDPTTVTTTVRDGTTPTTVPGTTPTTVPGTTPTTVPGTTPTTVPGTTPTTVPGTTPTTVPGTTPTTVPGTLPPPGSPIAVDDQAVTPEDVTVTVKVLSNDTDPQGELDPTSLTIVADASHGSTGVVDGALVYQPDPNFTGVDVIGYQVCNTLDLCDTATLTVTVTPVNDAPLPGATSATIDEGEVLILPLGITDPDGDTLSCVLDSPPALGAATVPADCSELIVSPPANFFGTLEIVVAVDDGQVVVPITITVTVNPVDDAPVAANDTAQTPWTDSVTIAVLANDVDVDGDSLTVELVSAPSTGSASVVGDTVVYDPVVGGSGTFSFDYRICDPAGACDTATITVTVIPTTVAVNDFITVRSERNVRIVVLANDTLGNGDLGSVVVVRLPRHGTVRVIGSGAILYRSFEDFEGTDSFVYRVCDSDGSCDVARVFITVVE